MRKRHQNRINVKGLANGEVVRTESTADPYKHFEKFYLVGEKPDGQRFRRLIASLPCQSGGARRFAEGARVKRGVLRVALVSCHKGFGINMPDTTFTISVVDLL